MYFNGCNFTGKFIEHIIVTELFDLVYVTIIFSFNYLCFGTYNKCLKYIFFYIFFISFYFEIINYYKNKYNIKQHIRIIDKIIRTNQNH